MEKMPNSQIGQLFVGLIEFLSFNYWVCIKFKKRDLHKGSLGVKRAFVLLHGDSFVEDGVDKVAASRIGVVEIDLERVNYSLCSFLGNLKRIDPFKTYHKADWTSNEGIRRNKTVIECGLLLWSNGSFVACSRQVQH